MKAHKGPSVTFLLSDVKDEELKHKLESQFIAYETLKKINVEAQRDAMRGQANALKTAAEVQLAQLDFLIQAGDAFDLISTEPLWMVRRRADGDVALECLLTEKDMQKMARAHTKHMKDQMSEITGKDDDDEDEEDNNGMFSEK